MKGVTYLQVSYVPEAKCVEDSCRWQACGNSYERNTGQRVRSLAQKHVKDSGHEVTVDLLSRTFYGPEPGGEQ